MNNTEKLLRAFIEASGYDIEETSREERVWVGVYDGEEVTIPQDVVDYKVIKKIEQSKEDLIIDMCQEIFKHSEKIKNNVTEINLGALRITLDKVSGELSIGGYNENI